jgi:beta-lactamase class A
MREQTAEEQLTWLVDASTRAPLPDDEISRHLAPDLLAASGGPAGLNAALSGLGRLSLTKIVMSQGESVQAAISSPHAEHLMTIHVSPAGLVDDFGLTVIEAPPTSWTQVDTQLAGLAARVSFAAAEIGADGQCRIVHGVDADTQRPIGSAFKLYVLGALAQAVADERASWDERLAIREDWKSLPSGLLQDRPAGTPLTLAEFADHMISISDNTATDHLIHRLGRDAVQRQLALFGNQRPQANIPFLTTRAFFQLKADPARAEHYLALPPRERVAALEELERLPLPDLRETWHRPEKIDEIEYFASPAEICHAYAALLRLDQPEIHQALSLNDDGLRLDTARFPSVWYKGGSEPGVVTLHYLARTTDARTLITSLMISDPDEAPDTIDVALKAQSAIRGAFELLIRQP